MYRQSNPHRMQFSRLDDMTSIRLQTRNPGTQPQYCEFKEIKIGQRRSTARFAWRCRKSTEKFVEAQVSNERRMRRNRWR